ncbi:MAG: hypothetical protein ACO1SV_06385 [Fimbriimonas sp.]
MPLPALALPNDIHLVVQQTLQPTTTQQPQVLEPGVLTPNNPNVGKQGGAATATGAGGPKPYRTFFEGYFDAGVSDLIGTFSTQVLRYGVRSGQHDVHAFVRNETLDTTGTDLPFRAIVQGTSLGAAYRYWFPGNKLFATAQYGRIVAGNNKGKDDVRVGLAGFTNSSSEKFFNDLYGDFFYIDIAKDTFLSARIRSGYIIDRPRDGVLTAYAVGQGFASGKGLSGTENRVEAGVGLGYVYKGMFSANLELRAGYAFRGTINERTYINPQFIISGGF